MKRLTIKDIANHFKVSISTVSKALNDSYEISAGTKEKIQKFAKENNYKPNFNALSLKNRKTKTIGIIIPNMLNYFFAQVFKGVEKIANSKGYKIISCISNESFNKEVQAMEMLSNGSIDGFILSIAEETEIKNNFDHFEKTINEGTPIVMFDRIAKNIHCDKVITNDYHGAINAVNHLSKTGHKNIVFISTMNHLQIGQKRLKGYVKGLEMAGMPINEDLIINIQEEDYKKYESILTPIFANRAIDSVIATDESSAIAAMKVAIRKGYKVPENFSVIAFSNGILARHSSPKLTTISQHGELMGATAAKMLINRLEQKKPKEDVETVIIKTDLVERKSTKPSFF
ncbi:LacI family DNA-binding transcriptional regulator [Tenacibaculum maritimum]|uniref:Transcriptional regulator, LacI family n=2 Tax=Tenacibaculum maritimum TaxID=107401 RepID=A0A2H1ED47_9FLAO|nr:LacI family DNA-binding transcriptional regulator [Tenacibaculum maritimum]MCD9582068.1 LacI family transcriptional regulator [Tenacibaculum maritimum]MCD9609524.1 LacI family transcriptional regulator [Tenacibaculum maritimum]MCD9636445.1 LacI family transcriptional regulator [Tenacibaculum maritimum]QCD63243.1 LacI family transcriptional regulator [Tenacibaculum maritimum]CAA0147212.1 Transcriptional regulator, LacI family [Tenacibaculum maritimum]